MHEDALDEMAVINLGNLVNGFSDLGVGVAGLDHAVAEVTHSTDTGHQIVLHMRLAKTTRSTISAFFSSDMFSSGMIMVLAARATKPSM